MNTLTVNLHLLMSTFYRPTPERFRIVIEDAAFPSDSHAVASQVRHHGFDPATRSCGCGRARARRRCAPRTSWPSSSGSAARVALVLLGGVNYLTGELVDIPAGHRGGPRDRRGRRLGSGARGRQRAARAARLGRRLGRLVPLQVRQCRAGRARRRVRARAPRDATRRCRGWRAGGATTRRRASAWSPGSCRAPGAVGWQVSTPPVLAFAPLRASLELFDARRHAGAARALAAPHRLPRVAARRRRRRAARADPHAARPGAARLPALALRSRRRARSRRACAPSTA